MFFSLLGAWHVVLWLERERTRKLKDVKNVNRIIDIATKCNNMRLNAIKYDDSKRDDSSLRSGSLHEASHWFLRQ